MHPVTELLRAEGHARLTAAEVFALAGPHGDALASLAPSWHALPPDAHLRDGGRYRSRRHACFVQEFEPSALMRAPHRAHWQPTTYNALHVHGGYGFMLEYDVQLYYRRARGWARVWGDADAAYRRAAATRYGAAR